MLLSDKSKARDRFWKSWSLAFMRKWKRTLQIVVNAKFRKPASVQHFRKIPVDFNTTPNSVSVTTAT